MSDLIFLSHHIGSGIGSDSKLSQRKGIVMIEDIFFDKLPVFLFILEVSAGILCDLSILEADLQILIFQSVSENFLSLLTE